MQGLEVGNLARNTRIATTYKSVTYLLNSYIVQFLRHKSCDNLIYRAWAITNTVANCLLILSMGCLEDYHCSMDKGAALDTKPPLQPCRGSALHRPFWDTPQGDELPLQIFSCQEHERTKSSHRFVIFSNENKPALWNYWISQLFFSQTTLYPKAEWFMCTCRRHTKMM